MKRFFFSLLILLSSASPTLAEDVFQTPESFVSESFDGAAPNTKTLSVDGILKEKMGKIMGTHYRLPKIQYWSKNGQTLWILEDIGKFKPITTGFVVSPDGTLSRVKVLVYRESHGWEVKHDFFTRQFNGTGLKREKKLDQRIDGISGATLSVDALKRLGALALLFHHTVSSSP